MKKIIGLSIVHALSIINFGPSGVHALPLGIAAEQSVHYIAKLSPSSSFSWAELALFSLYHSIATVTSSIATVTYSRVGH